MFTNALNLAATAVGLNTSSGGDEFEPPTIGEFFPQAILFPGTIFEMNRIMMIRILILVVLLVIFSLWTSKFQKAYKNQQFVPSRFQLMGEISINFVRKSIAHEQLGEKDGDRFLPLLATTFFIVLGMNITGIIPSLNIAGTSVIGLPIVLAAAAYFTFIYAGIKKHGAHFFKLALIPDGVPKAFLPLVFLIELLSTFILRPVTLALRLTMNMVAGHLLLVLCFSATQFFFFSPLAEGITKAFGAGTLLFGFVFTLFEILVAFLQAYVFTLLATVYIQLALADEH
ncbi:MAG: F0F1 ATP synthase subunit A [Rhodoluna sp.]|nr:F0F1 ATP synthase subunit A [Rhodoluna sp.]